MKHAANGVLIVAVVALSIAMLAFLVAVPIAVITQMNAPLWERIAAAAFVEIVAAGSFALLTVCAKEGL